MLALVKTEPYSVYLRAYSKAASGSRVSEKDFRIGRLIRRDLDLPAQLAVALAIHDVNKDAALRSKAEVAAEVTKLLA